MRCVNGGKAEIDLATGMSKSDKVKSSAESANSERRAQAWRIAEELRQMIVRGTLATGVHLSQEGLAESFAVSRFPIREALKLLAAETIVLHDLNRGFFVAALSSSEARQLYRLRKLVETELFAGLIWPTAQQLKSLEALFTELVTKSKQPRRTEYVHVHAEFQKALIRLSDQDVIVREAERLWTLTERYRSFLPYNINEPMKRRSEIMDALRVRDRRKLINAVDLGRQEALDLVLASLESRGL
jgi:DNA-binding GntR family transcriptional regulator